MKENMRGFTLIEIMLVLVIMTVLMAMVAPNFFTASQGDVKTEARFLQKVLRLASEEAQLRGKPVRCSVYSDQLIFEVPAQDGTWMPMQLPEFQNVRPKPPIEVLAVRLNGDMGLNDTFVQGDELPPLAHLMFWADGSLTTSEMDLGIPKHDEHITIALQAGAGGIHVLGNGS